MDYLKCCCLRIVVIFLALSSCTLVSHAIPATRKIKSGKGFDGSGLAEMIALPIQEQLPRTLSGDGKKLLEVREVIGTIKADYPGSKAERRAAATPWKVKHGYLPARPVPPLV